MSIPKALAHNLLNIAQVVLSSVEMGNALDAKCGLLRLSAIISVETDRSEELEKWKAATMP